MTIYHKMSRHFSRIKCKNGNFKLLIVKAVSCKSFSSKIFHEEIVNIACYDFSHVPALIAVTDEPYRSLF